MSHHFFRDVFSSCAHDDTQEVVIAAAGIQFTFPTSLRRYVVTPCSFLSISLALLVRTHPAGASSPRPTVSPVICSSCNGGFRAARSRDCYPIHCTLISSSLPSLPSFLPSTLTRRITLSLLARAFLANGRTGGGDSQVQSSRRSLRETANERGLCLLARTQPACVDFQRDGLITSAGSESASLFLFPFPSLGACTTI